MDRQRVKRSTKIPAISIDLCIAAVIYLASVILIYSGQSSFAEQGYALNSGEVYKEQLNVMLLGVAVWLIYTLVFVLLKKRTLGFILTRLYPESDTDNLVKRYFLFMLGPTLIIDYILGYQYTRSSEHSTFANLSVVIGSLASVGAIPGVALYVFILGFIIVYKGDSPFVDPAMNTDYRYSVPRINCDEDQDLAQIKKQTVEIITDTASGTGFLISDSLLLTSYHVVEGAKTISIRESTGRVSKADLYKVSEQLDSAILIGQFKTYDHIEFANPSDYDEGINLYAIGYPGSALREVGVADLAVSKGVYSSLISFPNDGLEMVQTDTSVNPGNSGGPLVNGCGQVFGVVTLGERLDQMTGIPLEGLNYAVSSGSLLPGINAALAE